MVAGRRRASDHPRQDHREVRLAKLLNDLDCHLTLWLAKHDGWLPGRPDHALVYLVDEEKHGLGFPRGPDQAVEEVVSPSGDATGAEEFQQPHRYQCDPLSRSRTYIPVSCRYHSAWHYGRTRSPPEAAWSAKNTAVLSNQSREAHHTPRPLHSPEGAAPIRSGSP